MVMSQIITDEQTLIATTADVLAGTQLAQPNVPGVFTIFAASTVGDTTITVTLGGRTLITNGIVILRANSEIRENEDTFIQGISSVGGRPIITITEATSMVCRIRTKFLPAFAS